MKKHSIVMYGGAFNPPHLDHTGTDGIIGRLLDTMTEKVVIIPTGKREDKGYHGISDIHRMEMLMRATAAYGERVVIDPVLLEGKVESTTLAQSHYLREKYGHEVAQVFGSDVAPRMREWDPTGYVADVLPKIFVARPGHQIVGVGNYDTMEFSSRGFSSTTVRRDIARILGGKGDIDTLRHMVQSSVLEYILQNHLFYPS